VRLDYSIELAPAVSGRIFVANAELHSHGVATPDLGIGAYRSATILNTVLGRERYPLPRHTAYTSFAPPERPVGAGYAVEARESAREHTNDGSNLGREQLGPKPMRLS
jgi:hypothetical protein